MEGAALPMPTTITCACSRDKSGEEGLHSLEGHRTQEAGEHLSEVEGLL